LKINRRGPSTARLRRFAQDDSLGRDLEVI
jgi:hypothetical protein